MSVVERGSYARTKLHVSTIKFVAELAREGSKTGRQIERREGLAERRARRSTLASKDDQADGLLLTSIAPPSLSNHASLAAYVGTTTAAVKSSTARSVRS